MSAEDLAVIRAVAAPGNGTPMAVIPCQAPTSRYLNFYWALGAPLAVMALLLLFEPTRLDFSLAQHFYQPGSGFIWRHNFWLEEILHDYAKAPVIILGAAVIVAWLLSLLVPRVMPWRPQLGYLVLAMGLSTAIITPLKAATNMHCPWDLSTFGGSQPFRPLLAPQATQTEPGRCWPGGHAATGFSLLAFFFVLRDRHPRKARLALLLALSLGALFSLGRMLQGAHFLSHNLWTLLLDWTICLLAYRFLLYRSSTEPGR